MKKIGVILIMSALLSCEKISLTTQVTNIKDSKVEEINKENKDIKTKNSGTASNLVLPSSTPKPVITPVPSVIPVVIIPTPLSPASVSTSTSNSVNSQSTFVTPVVISTPLPSAIPSPTVDSNGYIEYKDSNGQTISCYTGPLKYSDPSLPPLPRCLTKMNGFENLPTSPAPPYSEINPLPPEELKDGRVYLIFRDEIKIRREVTNIVINDNTVKFKSLLPNVDLNLKYQIDSINQIMKDFNINDSEVFVRALTEKEASEDELLSERIGYDVANSLSTYTIVLKNKNMASLITKLRPFYIVRSCNYDPVIGVSNG